MKLTRRQLIQIIKEEMLPLLAEDSEPKCYEIWITIEMESGPTPDPMPLSDMDPDGKHSGCFPSKGEALAAIEEIVSDESWDQNSPVRFTLKECDCPVDTIPA